MHKIYQNQLQTWLCTITSGRQFFEQNFLLRCNFTFGGYVNKQNCRIWGSVNTQVIEKRPKLHPKKLLFAAFFVPKV